MDFIAKVIKMGRQRMVNIPSNYRDYFKAGDKVKVLKIEEVKSK